MVAYSVILFCATDVMALSGFHVLFSSSLLFADGTLAQSATIVGEGTFHNRIHTAAQRHERQSNGKKESTAQTYTIDIYIRHTLYAF